MALWGISDRVGRETQGSISGDSASPIFRLNLSLFGPVPLEMEESHGGCREMNGVQGTEPLLRDGHSMRGLGHGWTKPFDL